MKQLNLPATEDDIRALKVGDQVEISGVMITARDAAHAYLIENDAPEVREVLNGGVIYHCGPVVSQEDDGWKFVAAGPTTSIREEPYEADVIARFGVRGIIGKGGMGKNPLDACREHGCVYFHAVGGAAVLLAERVTKVRDVFKLEEFGPPEAMWVIEVDRFPVVVTMDAHGNNMQSEIESQSEEKVKNLLASS